jgi:DNA-directed RNA polymerase subunit RPC12/RpoP
MRVELRKTESYVAVCEKCGSLLHFVTSKTQVRKDANPTEKKVIEALFEYDQLYCPTCNSRRNQ